MNLELLIATSFSRRSIIAPFPRSMTSVETDGKKKKVKPAWKFEKLKKPAQTGFKNKVSYHGTCTVEAAPQDIAHNELGGNFVGHLQLALKNFFKSKTHPKFTR